MTFKEAVHTIDHAGKRKKLYPIYLRLERMRLLFDALAIDPAAPSVHIAGTSGKGSTSSLAAEVLKQAGYVVGLHTTPHLQTPRERMQVNGVLPTEQEFADAVEAVYKEALYIEDTHSYGAYSSQELMFSVAAYYFKQKKVDIAVIETFMGGQYDPTNVIKPLVSVITNVDLDHVGLLGKTIESIAMVKSGVIKPETPFITGATQPSVLEIFKRRAADAKTTCIVVGEESTQPQSRLLGQKGSILSAQVLNNLFSNLHISLLGKHQVNNALLSLYIIQVLRTRGWMISDEAIREAFISAFIPGRLEIVEQTPTVILDGAHNPAKTKALAISLRRIFPHKRVVFVFAMKKGKALEDSIKPLLPLASKFIITRFSEKKSQSTKITTQLVKGKGIAATTRLDPLAAVKLAKNQVRKDEIICITGSLYLVGKLRSEWHPEIIDSVPTQLEDSHEISIVGEHSFPVMKERR
jgi:dihydrofolate synthase/folylpolyglutamate synthase